MDRSLRNGKCSRIAKEGNDRVWELFLSTPEHPEKLQQAIDICQQCNIVVECFIIHYDNETMVAAGMHPYDRKVLKWKRIDELGDSNWRTISECLSDFRRVEGEDISSI